MIKYILVNRNGLQMKWIMKPIKVVTKKLIEKLSSKISDYYYMFLCLLK